MYVKATTSEYMIRWGEGSLQLFPYTGPHRYYRNMAYIVGWNFGELDKEP